MIEIDARGLTDALERRDEGWTFYLNRQTGEILELVDEGITGEPQLEERERLENEHGQWARIEPLSSRDEFRIMEDFVAELPDGEAKRTLIRALSWQKPFSNFRNALYELPELKTVWFDFHHARIRQAAEEWLADEGIEARLK